MSPHDPHLSGMMAAHDVGLGAVHAGAMLREAREAAGLSIDMVSQQLKLAPRQVQALEDGEFALLPGRTFVRGFARNYARLVHLDPQVVLDALSGGPVTGGLESPPLHPTTITRGELPLTGKARSLWLRWAIPLLLLAVVVAAIVYEYADRRRSATAPAVSPPSAATRAEPDAAATVLPNPVVSAPLDASGKAQPDSVAAAPANTPSDVGDGASIPLQLTLRGSSWVEVKDGARRTLIAQTLAAGQRQSVVGTPPFEVTIGNALEVTLNYRGQRIDLAPYTHQNVARLTLQ